MPSACQPYASPTAPVRLHVADTSPTTSMCPYIGKQHVPSHTRASACRANAPLVTLARPRAGQRVCLRGTHEYFLFYLFRFINCKYPCASRRVLGYISMPARRQTCPQTRQHVRTQADAWPHQHARKQANTSPATPTCPWYVSTHIFPLFLLFH